MEARARGVVASASCRATPSRGSSGTARSRAWSSARRSRRFTRATGTLGGWGSIVAVGARRARLLQGLACRCWSAIGRCRGAHELPAPMPVLGAMAQSRRRGMSRTSSPWVARWRRPASRRGPSRPGATLSRRPPSSRTTRTGEKRCGSWTRTRPRRRILSASARWRLRC